MVSIIVPIYNVERYLNKCIESIVNQVYRNIEILLIDDGSPDGCGIICDEWAKLDSRIRVFHQENRGVSAARNIGLKNMRGEYFTAIDPDDYVDCNYVQVLLNELKINDADLSFCGTIDVDESYEVIEIYNRRFEILEQKNNIENYIFARGRKYVVGGVCKLFKSRIVRDNGIRYNEKLKNGEDHLFLHDYLQFANRTVHCGRSLYYCLSRPNSASSNARGSSFSLPMLVLWNEVKNENVKCSFGWRFYILGVALHVYLECLKFGKMDINEFCEIKSFLKKYRFIYFFKAKATFKEKLKMVFKMYFPKLFLRIPR